MKKYLLMLILILIPNFSFAWQTIPAENLYRLSENEQYLLQIIPMAESVNNLSHRLERDELTVIVYEKQSKKNKDIAETIYWWQEISFFRIKLPDTVKDKFAEAIQAIISNDGNRIIIRSLVNPMGAINPINELFIYNRKGSLLRNFSKKDIFDLEGTFFGEQGLSLKIDEGKHQLNISLDNSNKTINLKSMNMK
ncbi:MAG: hypothetical protein KKD05_05430 [Candidatus Omnitrophica bacterium]|nr:hypothetical protein [Candidatus Omnitrophota bacterium]